MNSDLTVKNNITKFTKLMYLNLSSNSFISLRQLEESYKDINPIMHKNASSSSIDFSVFSYVVDRLPDCIFNCSKIIFGQSEILLKEHGIDVSTWSEVTARSRRRRCLYNNGDTLAAFISSKSDLDDIIPSLLAFQIEWNKIHYALNKIVVKQGDNSNEECELCYLEQETINKLKKILKTNPEEKISIIKSKKCNIKLQNYESSYRRYNIETENWWAQIKKMYPEIEKKSIYFVSSNTHSLINLFSGFAESIKDEILNYASTKDELIPIVEEYNIRAENNSLKKQILYYLLGKYESSSRHGKAVQEKRMLWEKNIGITRISSTQTLDIPTQIIDLNELAIKTNNMKIGVNNLSFLKDSNSIILNIDYPLGKAAYFILSKIAEHNVNIKGIYILGKAATLCANRGDILIPNYILDLHTQNEYIFNNCIRFSDIENLLSSSNNAIYDNQKAVTVLGTLLQNKELLTNFLLSEVTDLEMEAGPYLSAIYEAIYPKRYPENQTVILNTNKFDIGIIHYVSDNPLSNSTLDTPLAVDGIDATYVSSLVVINKILDKERGILNDQKI